MDDNVLLFFTLLLVFLIFPNPSNLFLLFQPSDTTHCTHQKILVTLFQNEGPSHQIVKITVMAITEVVAKAAEDAAMKSPVARKMGLKRSKSEGDNSQNEDSDGGGIGGVQEGSTADDIVLLQRRWWWRHYGGQVMEEGAFLRIQKIKMKLSGGEDLSQFKDPLDGMTK